MTDESDEQPPRDGIEFDAPAYDFLKTEQLKGKASTRTVASLIQSMKEFGWVGGPIDAIEIDAQKYIINGHHRVFAARIANIAVRYRIITIDQLKQYRYANTDQVLNANSEAAPHRIRLGR